MESGGRVQSHHVTALLIYLQEICVARAQETPVAAARQLEAFERVSTHASKDISKQVRDKPVTFFSDENLWGV